MAETTVSVRVDEQLHRQMKRHEEINWSAVLRKSIAEQIEKTERIDYERAQQAIKRTLAIRKLRLFDYGKSSTELIREWRLKRR